VIASCGAVGPSFEEKLVAILVPYGLSRTVVSDVKLT
jgi:hypothetical protein